jgi:hypothetical protein
MANKQDERVRWDAQRKCYVARLIYRDEHGNKKEIRRQVENVTEGRKLLKKLERQIELQGPAVVEGEKLLFSELARTYKKEHLIEPVYEDSVRIAGLRSYKDMRRKLDTLVQHFGSRRVASITHGDILRYKLKRLRDPNKRDARGGIESKVKIATVNRELALLRAVLNFAKRRSWIGRNPFELGDSLVSIAAERKRDRTLTREEEARLLVALETPYRRHLRPIVIAALDTGLRKGDRWSCFLPFRRSLRV